MHLRFPCATTLAPAGELEQASRLELGLGLGLGVGVDPNLTLTLTLNPNPELEQAFACGSLLSATPSMPWLPDMVYR